MKTTRKSKRQLALFALALWLLVDQAKGVAAFAAMHNRRPKPVKHAKPAHNAKRTPPAPVIHNGARALIDAWLARPELAHSLVGVDLIDMSTGEELVQANGRRRFTPASTAKLFVTACAYETLGPDFTYRTRLYSKARIDGDRLAGDVLVAPSQDPSLSRADLSELLATLKKRGIISIQGKIVEADVPGGGERFLAEWLCEDWAQDWMPPSSSLVVDRNVSSPSFFSNAKLSVVEAHQSTNALNKTLLANQYTNGWLSLTNDNQSIVVHQSKPEAGKQALKVVANPDAYNIALLNDMAFQSGIKVLGQNLWLPQGWVMSVLAEHQSKPLSIILKTTLKESDNLYAQQILRTLGLTQNGSKAKNTLNLEQRGLQKIMNWVQTIGVPAQEVVLWDGCGLSRKDCVSPYSLNLVLRHMAVHPATAGYLALLNRATVSPAGGFQFKTGAMDSVRGISGILENYEGKRLALTVLVNGHTPSVRDLRTSIGALVNQLANASTASLKDVQPATRKK
ncbi:MAG: D-alanyl-D-alanine carboxypeptidase/D-alanyl-D-alanine-endopeptidase [Candidatus Melainabacteria bacterium]|nr:MAG: D-alanyl-D-alanine carboxypeptidase/D-alanyl-D-alanine-endopeptidase [Candidatus Melainabacteria bacterium]